MILGIVGGIASGKSTVTGILTTLGCVSVDADRLAHETLDEPYVRQEIKKEFGEEVFAANGEVDRKALARLVFGADERVKTLNSVVHPRVQERILDQIARHRRAQDAKRPVNSSSILVLDVSLLASSPLAKECDVIIYVDADLPSRLARCRDRGWSATELERREAHQVSLEQKKSLARWTVSNSGSLEETREQVVAILQELGTLT